MQVKIEEIQDKGLSLNEAIPRAVLEEALAGSGNFKLSSSSALKADFKRLAGRVLLDGSFEAKVSAPCNRCVNDVLVNIPVRFSLNFVPQKPRDPEGEGDDDGAGPNAGSFRIDEVDSEPFDGKVIRLDPIIAEQLVLALPVSILCREDCKGLCSVCGEDLNDKECGCQRKVVDIRLAKLKDIKIN